MTAPQDRAVMPERVRRCTTHFNACDCREWRMAQRVDDLERALVHIQGACGAPDAAQACRNIIALARIALGRENYPQAPVDKK